MCDVCVLCMTGVHVGGGRQEWDRGGECVGGGWQGGGVAGWHGGGVTLVILNSLRIKCHILT